MSSIGAQAPRVAASGSPHGRLDRRNPRQYPLELVILGAPPPLQTHPSVPVTRRQGTSVPDDSR